MNFKSSYIAFSAPSGGGKTTIVKQLARKYPQMVISVSATTRPPRPGEVHGRDYYFLSKKEFEQAIHEGRFLEYEQVHGYYYGTLRDTVEEFRRQGRIILFDIDVNGALSIKKHHPETLLIFIKPPDEHTLLQRLHLRHSENEEEIKKRLARLPFEYEKAREFDHIVINDDLQQTLKEIEKIIIKDE